MSLVSWQIRFRILPPKKYSLSKINFINAISYSWTRLFQKVNSAIYRINHYPAENTMDLLTLVRWIVNYPVDSAIHLLNNRGLDAKIIIYGLEKENKMWQSHLSLISFISSSCKYRHQDVQQQCGNNSAEDGDVSSFVKSRQFSKDHIKIQRVWLHQYSSAK